MNLTTLLRTHTREKKKGYEVFVHYMIINLKL